jgi:hypothetical protein
MCLTLPNGNPDCYIANINTRLCEFDDQNGDSLYQITRHGFNASIVGLIFALLVTFYLSLYLMCCNCCGVCIKPELTQHAPLSEV